jgi:hypothetical protein
MYSQKNNLQPALPTECGGCFLGFINRCKGPEDKEAYFKDDESVHSCVVPLRRDSAFSDTYDQTPIPYTSSYQRQIKLPLFIPEVKTGLNLENCKEIEFFAVSLGDITGTKGNILFKSVDEIRERYRLPENCKVILIGTAKDEILQTLWANSDKLQIWKHIANMGFNFITSFSFSVWDDDPRTDQIINQDRNFLTHDYFAHFRVPSIPFVFPFNEDDYEAFGKWIAERQDINIVAVYATSYSKIKNFSQLLKNIRKIQTYAKRKLKFLVIGAGTKEKITRLISEFDVCVVLSKPFQSAKSGEICTDDLKYKKYEELSRDELASINFEKNLNFCDNVKRIHKKVILVKKKEIFRYEPSRKMELSNVPSI